MLTMAGFFTRAAAFISSGTMAVAYFWKHQAEGLLPIQNGGEIPVLYCFGFVLLVITGGGALAIDNLIRKQRPVDAVSPAPVHTVTGAPEGAKVS